MIYLISVETDTTCKFTEVQASYPKPDDLFKMLISLTMLNIRNEKFSMKFRWPTVNIFTEMTQERNCN